MQSASRRLLSALARRILWCALGGRVLSGPFRGMRYSCRSVGSAFCPKIIGTYEMELSEVMSWISGRTFDRVIDICAAEGYYAVGLARMLGCNVHAFETEQDGQHLVAQMARSNHVHRRVSVHGICDPCSLSALLASTAAMPTLMVCDIEGFEGRLLDPVIVPGLSDCFILVEVHEQFVPGVQALLQNRFAMSHEMQFIDARLRQTEDFPAGWVSAVLPDAIKLRLMWEHRAFPMGWFWMRPRKETGHAGAAFQANAGTPP